MRPEAVLTSEQKQVRFRNSIKKKSLQKRTDQFVSREFILNENDSNDEDEYEDDEDQDQEDQEDPLAPEEPVQTPPSATSRVLSPSLELPETRIRIRHRCH